MVIFCRLFINFCFKNYLFLEGVTNNIIKQFQLKTLSKIVWILLHFTCMQFTCGTLLTNSFAYGISLQTSMQYLGPQSFMYAYTFCVDLVVFSIV